MSITATSLGVPSLILRKTGDLVIEGSGDSFAIRGGIGTGTGGPMSFNSGLGTTGPSGPFTLTANELTINPSSIFVQSTITGSWTTSPTYTGGVWTIVCWSPDLNIFCALSTGLSMISSDGLIWTSNVSYNSTNNSLIWSSKLQLFITGSNDFISTSPSGTSWTTRTTILAKTIIESSELNLLCALGTSGGSVSALSSDGIIWTTYNAPSFNNSVAWSPALQKFCAIGTAIMTSFNGTAWTTISIATANNWVQIVWSPVLQIFCAINSNRASSGEIAIITSSDGITWATQTLSGTFSYNSLVYAKEISLFCSVSQENIIVSSTGTLGSWTSYSTGTGTTNNWSSVCWSPELYRFLAISNTNALVSNTLLNPLNKNTNIGSNITNLEIIGNTSTGSTAQNISIGPANDTTFSTMTVSGTVKFAQSSTFNYNNANIGITSSGVVQDSSTGLWFQGSTPTNNSWNSVCYANELNLFCAVSITTVGNVVIVSQDGLVWTTKSSTTNNAWESVCWSPELLRFCAVSSTGSGNRVMTSSDGSTWTSRVSPDYAWQSVCWSPELLQFCAVSVNGIMNSLDGITWTTSNSATNNSWESVCWSPTLLKFCAVSSTGSGNRAMTSSDGYKWTLGTATNNSWESVCWSPTLLKFCAVSSSGSGNRVMTSSDGIVWTTSSTNDNDWKSVVWSPQLSLFCAVSSTGTENRIMTSSDGINWVTKTPATDNQWSSIVWSPEVGIFSSVSLSLASNSAMISNPMYRDSVINLGTVISETVVNGLSQIGDNAVSIKIGEFSQETIIGQESGTTTFNSLSGPGDTNFGVYNTDIGHASLSEIQNIAVGTFILSPYTGPMACSTIVWSPELEIFCAFTDSITPSYARRSRDGLNWDTVIINSSAELWSNSLCWSPKLSLFCAISNNGIPIRSSDAITWLTSTAILTAPCMCWSPELEIFCAVTSTNIRSLLSSNGVNWTTYLIISSGSTLADIIWSPKLSLFCAVGNLILTSPNGIYWTSYAASGIFSITWSEELSLFVGSGTVYGIRSPDGIVWTSYTTPSIGRIEWSPELSIFMGDGVFASKTLYYSTNGILWTSVYTNTNYFWGPIAWSPLLMVFCALSFTYSSEASIISNGVFPLKNEETTIGTISGTNNITGKNIIIGKGSVEVNIGPSDTTIGQSTNGANIYGPSIIAENSILNTYHTDIGYSSLIDVQNIAVSTWTNYSATTPALWSSVCYSNELSLFCAVSNTSNVNSANVMISSNGSTWTSVSPSTPSTWVSVCWSPALMLFCAVAGTISGSNPTLSGNIMRSSTGTTWLSSTIVGSTADFLKKIIWAPELNLFVVGKAFNSTSLFYKSSDGITFTSTGPVNNDPIISMAWSPELGICIGLSNVAYGYYSYDIINWYTSTVTTTATWRDIAWSPELTKFVAVSGGGLAMYSSNGINWSPGILATSRTALFAVAWSPQLSLFVAMATTAPVPAGFIMKSTDGINWTSLTAPSGINKWSSMCWSSTLEVFCAIGDVITASNQVTLSNNLFNGMTKVVESNTIVSNVVINGKDIAIGPRASTVNIGQYSQELNMGQSGGSVELEGNIVPNGSNIGMYDTFLGYSKLSGVQDLAVSTWNISAIAGVSSMGVIEWSPLLNVFCAISSGRSPNIVIRSSNGVSWTSVSISMDGTQFGTLVWSKELEIFCTISIINGFSLISYDGISWTSTNIFNTDWVGLCWSPDLEIFCGVATTGNLSILSGNGINWYTYSATLANVGPVCWSSELGIFCVSSTSTSNIVYTSPNGITWTERTTGARSSSICWSPELNIFCVIASSLSTGAISQNGTTWTTFTGPFSTASRIIWNPQLSLFLSLAPANTSIAYSSNGVSWTTKNINAVSVVSLVWSPELSQFCLISASTSYTSTAPVAFKNKTTTIGSAPSSVNVEGRIINVGQTANILNLGSYGTQVNIGGRPYRDYAYLSLTRPTTQAIPATTPTFVAWSTVQYNNTTVTTNSYWSASDPNFIKNTSTRPKLWLCSFNVSVNVPSSLNYLNCWIQVGSTIGPVTGAGPSNYGFTISSPLNVHTLNGTATLLVPPNECVGVLVSSLGTVPVALNIGGPAAFEELHLWIYELPWF